MTITDTQQLIISRMGFSDPVETPHPCSNFFYDAIRFFSKNSVEMALGKIGTGLKEFVNFVDIEHPGVQRFFDDLDEDFIKDAHELLLLSSFAESANLTRILPDLAPKVINKYQELKRVGDPHKNQLHVRFLRERAERDRVRSLKKIQDIDLSILASKGQGLWDAQPNDFSMFIRGNIAYAKEIEQAKRKADRYLFLGCPALAKNISDTVIYFEKETQEIYYGFNRLTMTNVAIILAKMMGCVLQDNRIFVSFGGKTFDYKPKCYPLSVIQEQPESVMDIVNFLEKFPAACGKPIFDNFIVITPSIQIDRTYSEKAFVDQTAPPVLLGEKDGRCFFVCHYL